MSNPFDNKQILKTFEGRDLSGRILNSEYIRCNFRRAILSRATLSGKFTACDFRGALLSGTILSGEFKECKGLKRKIISIKLRKAVDFKKYSRNLNKLRNK